MGMAVTVGDHLRAWRERHRLSQLHCALEADISQRHLSFLETGRSRPSRGMVIHLAERLNIPLRERNAALLAAGFAPAYSERSLDDPEMDAARLAIRTILKGHEPFPALAIDRHWNMVHANDAVGPLVANVANQALLETPINVLRLSLHPQGLAPRIENLAEWRNHLMHRLDRQITATQDQVLIDLRGELLIYGEHLGAASADIAATDSVLVPLKLRTADGTLSFISTTTVFGTPRDVLLSELAIEAFFPENNSTVQYLNRGRSPSC
ncbi:transcriptional regulator [Pelagibacterium lentulum]|uniref:Transcriptional regulator n=2 Tax=Pelagibacterium lentulum TaxID=2029865 RepID=A0A916RQ36_9HYPH|nr:transcriptional regulator [Pelagibacterium lentulum]